MTKRDEWKNIPQHKYEHSPKSLYLLGRRAWWQKGKECTIRFCQVWLHQSFCSKFYLSDLILRAGHETRIFVSQFRRRVFLILRFKICFHYISEQNHCISKIFTWKAHKGKRMEVKQQIGQCLSDSPLEGKTWLPALKHCQTGEGWQLWLPHWKVRDGQVFSLPFILL